MNRCLLGIIVLVGVSRLFSGHGLAYAKEPDETQLRQAVVDAQTAREVAAAYRALFTRKGFAQFIDDPDIGIALQANWESNKIFVPRSPKLRHRSDWVLDKKRVGRFLDVLKKRIGTESPTWWNEALLNADVFPGRHLAFSDWTRPKHHDTKIGRLVPEGTDLTRVGDKIRVAVGADVLTIAKGRFEAATMFAERCCVLPSSKACFIAAYSNRGYPFLLRRVDLVTNDFSWSVDVWAARRGFSTGPPGSHSVALKQVEDKILVFGAESHGVYLEAVDAVSGEPEYRFCSCYWFNFSEKWGEQTNKKEQQQNADSPDQLR